MSDTCSRGDERGWGEKPGRGGCAENGENEGSRKNVGVGGKEIGGS